MEKLRIFALLIVFGLSLHYASAQCNYKQEWSSPEVFTQDPTAKAAMIAAADDTIEERLDKRSGKKYYVRRFVSPWSGEAGYHFLTFDQQLEQFVEHDAMALHGGQDDEAQKGTRTPSCQTQSDSTRMQQRKLLPEQVPANRQPRRSSRVKLASLF